MELKLRHLRMLLAIAEMGSMKRAAAAMMLAPSTLSAQLKAVEGEVGGPVFHRTPRGAVPTEAGRLVLAHAREALASADRIQAWRTPPNGPGTGGPVTIGCCPGPIPGHLAPLLPGSLPHPVELTLYGGPGEVLAAVTARTADAGFVMDVAGFGAPAPEHVALTLVGTEPVVVVLPAAHPLAARSRIDLPDLAAENWLLLPEDPGADDAGALVAVCAAAGFVPRVRHRLADFGALIDLVARGQGVAVGQGSARPREGVVMRPLTGDPLRVRHLLALHEHSPLANSRALLLNLAAEALPAAHD
ncbi:LysR family transcriptional regulator [Streptomyces sp. LP05-1]|uniref:LysR family transcriptional regulator n=1 Tax=Streptomyces pyxinae TaxID=2970734 RepID=A0ABT2CIK8_9ACTN|nr:LysR family transcriptional regulator [Streptomyces sp. LP05-1]MCS0636454.1 LysR family transcriptional regulator [Streptomyces sp. LP05-1]